MYTVKIEINKNELQSAIDQYGNLSKKTIDVMNDTLETWANGIKLEMKHQAPRFEGFLKDSITYNKIPTGSINSVAYMIGPEYGNVDVGGSTDPAEYAYYVETGKGPTDKLANPSMIAARMGIDIEEAFAFATWMKQTGKDKKPADPFVERTYNWISKATDQVIKSFVDNLVS